jgi:beta-lactamase superfamily II metal-dependent hydrolase
LLSIAFAFIVMQKPKETQEVKPINENKKEQQEEQTKDFNKSQEYQDKEQQTEQQALDENLTVYFIDVGQADSILVDLPKNEAILIDTATQEKADKIWSFLKEKNLTHLNYLIITHNHADHAGGAKKLIEAGLSFDKFLSSYFPCDSKLCELYFPLVMPKRVLYKPNDFLELNTKIKILNPDTSFYLATENDNSVVLHLTYGKIKFLFSADCETDCERRIVQNFNDIQADILKVGHHGSNTSSNSFFLEKVKPKIAVISVGENNYGHPSTFTLQRLKEIGATIYRTDLQGTITITTDGNNYTILTEKAS